MESMDKTLAELNTGLKQLAGIYRAYMGDGISENTFWIWYGLLVMGRDYTQGDLCTMWSLSKQTVNTIINNMEKNGFVTLEHVPGTRNKKHICLTEQGRAYGSRLIGPMEMAEKAALSRLSSEERMAFLQILNRYSALLAEEMQTACREARKEIHEE